MNDLQVKKAGYFFQNLGSPGRRLVSFLQLRQIWTSFGHVQKHTTSVISPEHHVNNKLFVSPAPRLLLVSLILGRSTRHIGRLVHRGELLQRNIVHEVVPDKLARNRVE